MFCYIIISFFIVPTFLYDNILKNNFFKKYFQKEVFIINFFFQKFFNLVYLKNKQITYPEYLELNKLKIINNTYNRHDDYFYTKKIVEHAGVELIWTIIPSIILVLIAIPSFALLYAMDEIIDPKVTVKAIGYQWFWN